MKLDDLTAKTFLHHAYCVVGERETVRRALFGALEKNCGVPTTGNPDFWYASFETFSVNDAANVKALQSNASLSARRVFVIAAHRILHEAQNKLLKILEEPTGRTHFFLIVPHSGRLLATVRSRLEFLEADQTGGQPTSHASGEAFLKAPIAGRLGTIQPLIDAEEGGREAAIDLLNEIEYALYLNKNKRSHAAVFLEDLATMRRYLEGRSPSRKMILEHIALTAPRI